MLTTDSINVQGWQMVPVEPTPEMHEAYLDAYGRGLGMFWIYKAMLAAASFATSSLGWGAARYRWARENWWTEHLDATIDAAIGKGGSDEPVPD